jgi:error-prone DNA polymerase
LAYVSAWLKRHHPAAFYTGLLNSQPMGFYSPSQLIQDARRHNVTILPIDVNNSDWDHQLLDGRSALHSQPPVRLGLRLVSGLSKSGAERLVEQRRLCPFRQISDLRRRAQLNKRDSALFDRSVICGGGPN